MKIRYFFGCDIALWTFTYYTLIEGNSLKSTEPLKG